jgi:hypothetical protein
LRVFPAAPCAREPVWSAKLGLDEFGRMDVVDDDVGRVQVIDHAYFTATDRVG